MRNPSSTGILKVKKQILKDTKQTLASLELAPLLQLNYITPLEQLGLPETSYVIITEAQWIPCRMYEDMNHI